MHKLNFLKTKLDSRSSNISRTEWDAYFICFFEAFQCYQEPTIASPQKILRLTEASKVLKENKIDPKGANSFSLASLSQAVPPSPSWVSSSAPCPQTHLWPLFLLPFSTIYAFSKPQLPQANYLVKLRFLSETLFHSLFLWTCQNLPL